MELFGFPDQSGQYGYGSPEGQSDSEEARLRVEIERLKEEIATLKRENEGLRENLREQGETIQNLVKELKADGDRTGGLLGVTPGRSYGI